MIYIITVYNSLNPGSYLQATSLYKYIEKQGFKVAFLDIGARNPFKKTITSSFKLLMKGKFNLAYQKLKMGYNYNQELKKYTIKSLDDAKMDKDGVFILGSDEIWNISRKNMRIHYVFWGIGINQKRCISYGPSINNATLNDFSKYNFPKEALENIAFLSVRDLYSKKILNKISNREIEVVCDPTMLIYNNSKNKIKRIESTKKYLLVYSFKNMINEHEIKQIKKIVEKNHLMLISFGTYFPWCDKTVMGTPEEFLLYIKNAEYIITTTFHGTIFSILLNKQFIVYEKNNCKVDELLNYFELNRKVKEEDIEKKLKENINYKKINKKIEQYKKDSELYLNRCIEKLKK